MTVQKLVKKLSDHGWVYDGDQNAYVSPKKLTTIAAMLLTHLVAEGVADQLVDDLIATTAEAEEGT